MRHGAGVSVGNYGEMNINPFCGDDISNVNANKIILSKILGIKKQSIILPHQIHEECVKIISEKFFSLPTTTKNIFLENTDSLVTNLKNICIGVSTADCVPILLFDKRKNISATVHAGWRGTVRHIAQKTILKMCHHFNSIPSDIHAIICPSISKASFEVGEEVYNVFKKDKSYPTNLISEYTNGKWHIDLWEANKLQLIEEGVRNENIYIAGICTYRNYQDFFSARRLSVNSGRIFNGIMIL
ncbi:MAG: peptidoglycan editing factor PgeF [Bacteroidaceae bacterium]